MDKAGITRRIDSLGRIVIPKEMRKSLKIDDSDEMSISIINNEIVLSKCDSLGKSKVINALINSLGREINKNVVVTSKDNIIDTFLTNKKEDNNMTLSTYAINIIKKRKELLENLGPVNLFNREETLAYIILPLIVNGDLVGSLIVFNNFDFTKEELKLIAFSKRFLENYLE